MFAPVLGPTLEMGSGGLDAALRFWSKRAAGAQVGAGRPGLAPVASSLLRSPLMFVLEGVRVLEVGGGVAGAFAGRLLRGYGADVRRVDVNRSISPTDDEVRYLHAGKLLSSAQWRDDLAAADIVISDLQPFELAAHGVEWAAVRSASPRLIVVSVTPFGLTGPYRDFQATNAVSFAMGGIMSLTGDPERAPLVTGGNQAQVLAGLNAFSAALVAWCGHMRNGVGDLIDISAQECATGMLELYGPGTAYGTPVMPRLGNHNRVKRASGVRKTTASRRFQSRTTKHRADKLSHRFQNR